jgi:CheY-like chemotaxis protein
MDGEIYFSPGKIRGSIFTFTLPLEFIEKSDARDANWEASVSPSETFNYAINMENYKFPDVGVLVVDDSQMNLELLCTKLKSMKINSDCAGSGKDALEKAKIKFYELIFMDIEMPEIDGIEAVQEIKKLEIYQNRNPYIIACTAHVLESSRQKFLDSGFNNYISKPILTSSLLQVLKEFEEKNNLKDYSNP